MSLYRQWVFPWLCEQAMHGPAFTEQRRALLTSARGDVLEIGVGTGLNLPHYPPPVRRIVGVDPNPGMQHRARRRAASVGHVQLMPGDIAAGLPLDSESFDTIVSTWTLCSVSDVPAALREVHRLLRPGGVFLFIEHGLAPSPRLARWQQRLTPVQRRLADGCHLDRDIRALVERSPLVLEQCDTFYLRSMPRLGGYTYRGAARKAGPVPETSSAAPRRD